MLPRPPPLQAQTTRRSKNNQKQKPEDESRPEAGKDSEPPEEGGKGNRTRAERLDRRQSGPGWVCVLGSLGGVLTRRAWLRRGGRARARRRARKRRWRWRCVRRHAAAPGPCVCNACGARLLVRFMSDFLILRPSASTASHKVRTSPFPSPPRLQRCFALLHRRAQRSSALCTTSATTHHLTTAPLMR